MWCRRKSSSIKTSYNDTVAFLMRSKLRIISFFSFVFIALLFWVLAIPRVLPICHPWRESTIIVPASFPLSEHINNFIVRWPCTGQTGVSRQFSEKNVITNVTRGFINSSISYTTLHLLASGSLDAVTLLEKRRGPKIALSYPKSLLELEERLNQAPDFVIK